MKVLTKGQLSAHTMRRIAEEVIVEKAYHSAVAIKYRVKAALVSWIVSKFQNNPQLFNDIEQK